MVLDIGDVTFHCNVIRSRRKTIELRLLSKNTLQLKIPQNMGDTEISSFLLSKSKWLLEKNQLVDIAVEKDYKDGTVVKYLGRDFTLKIKRILDKQFYASIYDNIIEIKINNIESDYIKKALEVVYRDRLKMIATKYVKQYTKDLGLHYNRIVIKEQKTRWGSCSSKLNLNFNWRLAMAPEEVVRYVVLHEVCHLKHLNHSSEFWSLVHSVMPDYEMYKEWLNKNGSKLMN